MKRKVYLSDNDRKHDRRRGLLAFLGVNVVLSLVYVAPSGWAAQLALDPAAYRPVLLGISLLTVVQLLPWIVNGLILVLGFIFRAEFAVGYIACFGTLLLIGFSLAAIFLVSCIMAIGSAYVVGPLAILVFLGLFLTGLFFFGKWIGPPLLGWWSDNDR